MDNAALDLLFKNLLKFSLISTSHDLKSLNSLDNKKPIILIIGAPKSGSTYLANVLGNITKIEFGSLVECQTQEHDLALTSLFLANINGCTAQEHMKGSLFNAQLLNKFNVKPIILFRNIYDTVISLARDLKRIQQHPNFLDGYGYAFIQNLPIHKNLNTEELYDLVINQALPWYIRNYVAWYELHQARIINPIWVTYEQITSKPDIYIGKILNHLETPIAPSVNVSSIISKHYSSSSYDHKGDQKTKDNSGINILSESQILRINKLIKFYPSIDFTTIGVAC